MSIIYSTNTILVILKKLMILIILIVLMPRIVMIVIRIHNHFKNMVSIIDMSCNPEKMNTLFNDFKNNSHQPANFMDHKVGEI